MSVRISSSHKYYFTRNLMLILAETRTGLEVIYTLVVRKITVSALAAAR